jgi:hypothetical protein
MEPPLLKQKPEFAKKISRNHFTQDSKNEKEGIFAGKKKLTSNLVVLNQVKKMKVPFLRGRS